MTWHLSTVATIGAVPVGVIIGAAIGLLAQNIVANKAATAQRDTTEKTISAQRDVAVASIEAQREITRQTFDAERKLTFDRKVWDERFRLNSTMIGECRSLQVDLTTKWPHLTAAEVNDYYIRMSKHIDSMTVIASENVTVAAERVRIYVVALWTSYLETDPRRDVRFIQTKSYQEELRRFGEAINDMIDEMKLDLKNFRDTTTDAPGSEPPASSS